MKGGGEGQHRKSFNIIIHHIGVTLSGQGGGE